MTVASGGKGLWTTFGFSRFTVWLVMVLWMIGFGGA